MALIWVNALRNRVCSSAVSAAVILADAQLVSGGSQVAGGL